MSICVYVNQLPARLCQLPSVKNYVCQLPGNSGNSYMSTTRKPTRPTAAFAAALAGMPARLSLLSAGSPPLPSAAARVAPRDRWEIRGWIQGKTSKGTVAGPAIANRTVQAPCGEVARYRQNKRDGLSHKEWF